jgi:hypothetical protein
MMTSEFEIKRYKKKDLARLYRPDTPTDAAAVELLRRDIHRCWELKEELEKLPSYNIHASDFPKEQVKLIIDFLGEP